MAVPKKKKSVSKKKSRKSVWFLKDISISIEKESNEIHLRHHLTINKFYRGNKIF